MAMRGGPRLLPVGSAAWIAEERDVTMDMMHTEIEEFSFAVRNDMDWLNEHMAEIFSENQINVTELFKTPGKLRGKTPRTIKKTTAAGEARVPLSDVFSSTPKGAPNPFALSLSNASRVALSPRIQIAEDRHDQASSRPTSPAKLPVVVPAPRRSPAKAPVPVTDSGYHGSQDDYESQEKTVEMASQSSPQRGVETTDFAVMSAPTAEAEATPTTASESFQSAKEEQTRAATVELTRNMALSSPIVDRQPKSPMLTRGPATIMSPHHSSPRKMGSPPKSPLRSSPKRSSPLKTVTEEHQRGFPKPTGELNQGTDEQDDDDDDMRSPSEASSPIRPIVRKSSLNFASLPAREPLTSKQSLGPRASILGNRGTSFYNPTKKSLGNVVAQDLDDEDQDEMDVDEPTVQRDDTTTNITAHAKTYTQRLQDQISMLGKSQPSGPRPSKSIHHLLPSQNQPNSYTQPLQTPVEAEFKKPSSPKPMQSVAAPGAFPEDDDDDWIAPPTKTAPPASPARPDLNKSHTADVRESVAGKDSISEFTFPSRPNSPGKAPVVPTRTTSSPAKHGKSASVPTFPIHDPFAMNGEDYGLKKTISVSNPTLETVTEDGSASPSKTSRTMRDSPLKQVKNKLSSILKSSKTLLASSAAISAEGKSSLLSPSTTRLGYHANASVDTFRTAENVLYPDLSQHGGSTSRPISPVRTNSTRRTRASTEREKREQKEKKQEAKEMEKEREREAKEAKRQAEQMKKLEKMREKEQEKARVFSKEQEKIAAMEKNVAAQKAPERPVQAPQQPVQTPAPPKTAPRSPPKPTRTSPRKTKGQDDGKTVGMSSDELDVDMVDAPTMMPPPSVPRSAAPPTARVPVPGTASKRPVKPTKDMPKPKQAPKLIRVNPMSQNPQFHPSNSMLAASLEDTLGPQQAAPPRQLNSKTSQSSLHTKPSLQSLNGSSKRPKALDMAARRKAEEERETQRKRDVKMENDRKRAAAEEERRQEQQRKLEAERQEEERRRLAAKKAAIEKAKQTKAPPPPARLQPNGPPDYSSSMMSEKGPARPPSRLGSTMHQDRPVNAMLSKSTSKRPLPDPNDDRTQTMRNPQAYQSQEPKRMRMSEEFDDDIETADTQRTLKGSAIRPPSMYKTDLSKQSMYSNGYNHAPPPSSGPKDLFRTTVTKQHTSHMIKAANPMDMAQVSKGEIPGLSHKTPARPAGAKQHPPKSAARSSPRYQNGDAIELPDIDTDDEDEDEDQDLPMAPWANSPALRTALMMQEDIDPMQIFGPPAPLNMEEVFNKDKSRWHKFRARTSSANWSGPDKLTEEEQKRDLRARDKIRKQGGWSYDLSKEL
ncbi:inner centromere protein-related protein pic1 [Rhypophila decipiens]|uniref:Inner centromere protein-related protein pic1 n=1 Tax=Rhypophila decipiens TaxID=261697 RepID=A0AAN6YM04_9PEZI|nr:inner centromere protein-related protein pic1 [Rhypophila decipiens]